MIQIHGKSDNHVPPPGRDLIRKTLHEKGVSFSFYEIAHAQRQSTNPPPFSHISDFVKSLRLLCKFKGWWKTYHVVL